MVDATPTNKQTNELPTDKGGERQLNVFFCHSQIFFLPSMSLRSYVDAVRRGVWKQKNHATENNNFIRFAESIAQKCPTDLLALVFSFLNAQTDRSSAVRVCVAWHLAMRREPSRQLTFYALDRIETGANQCWPSQLGMIRVNSLPSSSLGTTLSAFVHHVTCVRLYRCYTNRFYVTAPQAGLILEAFPMLRACHLRIGFSGRTSMHRERKRHAQRTWESLSRGLRSSKHLQEFDVDMFWDNDGAMTRRNSFAFSNDAAPSFADTTALIQAIATCPSLRSLRLWGWHESGVEHLDLTLLTRLPLLERLDLAWTLMGERCKCMGLGSDISQAQARVLASLPSLTSFNVLDGECTRSFRSMLSTQRAPSPFARRLRELHLQNAQLTGARWKLLGRMLSDTPIHTVHLDYTSLPAKHKKYDRTITPSLTSYPCFPSVRTLLLSREFEDDTGFCDYVEGDGFADRHEYDWDDTLYRLQRVYHMFPHVERLVMDEPMPQSLHDLLRAWWTDPTSPYFLHALHTLNITIFTPEPFSQFFHSFPPLA
jgi:hypothetical protein